MVQSAENLVSADCAGRPERPAAPARPCSATDVCERHYNNACPVRPDEPRRNGARSVSRVWLALIAAENVGRVCRGVELDPLYIDVIIGQRANLPCSRRPTRLFARWLPGASGRLCGRQCAARTRSERGGLAGKSDRMGFPRPDGGWLIAPPSRMSRLI